MAQLLWETALWPNNSLLRIYTREISACANKSCTWTFLLALGIMPKMRDNLKVHLWEWILKAVVYSYNGILISNKKEETPGTHHNVKKTLKIIISSEKEADSKGTYHLVSSRQSSVFLGGASGKEPTCQCSCQYNLSNRFNPWVRKNPLRRSWQPIPVFLPGES